MDAQRLKAVLHYICGRDRARPLTLSLLHRTLWQADGETYVRLGHALVGEDYVREVEGPRSIHLDAAIDELKREGRLETRPVQSDTEPDPQLIAHGAHEVTFLARDERKILDEVIRNVVHAADWQVRDEGAGSEWAGARSPGWKAAAIGERISYQQHLLDQLSPLTEDDADWIASELKDFR